MLYIYLVILILTVYTMNTSLTRAIDSSKLRSRTIDQQET